MKMPKNWSITILISTIRRILDIKLLLTFLYNSIEIYALKLNNVYYLLKRIRLLMLRWFHPRGNMCIFLHRCLGRHLLSKGDLLLVICQNNCQNGKQQLDLMICFSGSVHQPMQPFPLQRSPLLDLDVPKSNWLPEHMTRK